MWGITPLGRSSGCYKGTGYTWNDYHYVVLAVKQIHYLCVFSLHLKIKHMNSR